MPTSLEIDEHLFAAGEEIVRRECVPAGDEVCHLRCSPLTDFEPFAAHADASTTDEQVNALRDVEGI